MCFSYFIGASDVSVGKPHPKCYKNPTANSPPGYGICMLREFAGKYCACVCVCVCVCARACVCVKTSTVFQQ